MKPSLSNSRLRYSKKISILLFISIFTFKIFASVSTDYFRSLNSGNWSSTSSWQSSSDNINWYSADLTPTSSASFITIQSGHTISISGTTSASSLLIEGSGILTFDGLANRNLTITNDLTINNSLGSFIVQSNGNFTNTLTIGGNIINQGTFDLSRGTLTTVCDITFNKNGNQFVSGYGTTTRFNEITVDLGNNNSNILEISTDYFSAPDGFLETLDNVANRLKNGTLKLSGTFSYSGLPFIQNSYNNTIISTAGFWINNPNVNIPAINDSFEVSGKLQISNGSLSIGTIVGSCLKYATGSIVIIEGGNLNIISRIQGKIVATSTTTFTQSGGTITLMTSEINGSSTASLDFTAIGSSFTMSGGTIVFQNENGNTNKDVNIQCSTNITGGTFQFGNNSTLTIPDGFIIQSNNYLPSISLYSILIGSVYPQIKLSKNASIIGNISIGNSTTFDISIDGGISNYDLTLTGDFNNNGFFIQRNKTITFNGLNAQNIAGTTTTKFNNVTINNTSSTGITLSSPIEINGILNLTDGNIYSSQINSLTLNSGSSSISASNISFVDGPMVKIGSTDFIFPLGKNSNFNRLGISNLTGSETFTATYFNTTYANTLSFSSETNHLNWVSDKEYWTLNRLGTTNASLELFWQSASASNLSNCSNLKIGYWNSSNSYWEKTTNSDFSTITGSCFSTNSGSIKSASNLSSFGTFTFGRNASAIALPITLVSFQAKRRGTKVDLKWITMSEKNNDYFTLEKTKDGLNYEQIKKIKGAGNFNETIKYDETDENPYIGISYYRLSQTDFDGKQSYYPLQSVSFEIKNENKISVQPNPINLKDELKIIIAGEKNQIAIVSLFDSFGRTCFSNTFQTIENQNTIEITLPDNTIEGVYFLKIIISDKLYSEKLIVKY